MQHFSDSLLTLHSSIFSDTMMLTRKKRVAMKLCVIKLNKKLQLPGCYQEKVLIDDLQT